MRTAPPPQRWMLLGATAVCAVVPFAALVLESLAGPSAVGMAPWWQFLAIWPPFLPAWAWVWLGWRGAAWAETVTYFLVCAAGLVLADTVSPYQAMAATAALFILPLVGVFYRDWKLSLLGTVLAVGFSAFWMRHFAAGPLADAALAIGYVYGVLMSAVGLMDCLAAYLLAERERQLVAAGRRAQEQERLFRLLADNSADVVGLHELDGRILYISPSCQPQTGYRQEELIGESPWTACHPDDVQHLRAAFESARAGQSARVSCRIQAKAGLWVWFEIQTRPIFGTDGLPVQVQAAARDISERKAFEEQLAHQAFHDALTGLPNRALFQERVRHALALADRRRNRLGVLFVDLDNFKRVNDSLGHSAGDQLLALLGQRLARLVRPADTVARLGGDEFAVLLENVRGEQDAVKLAERIEAALRAPFPVEGRELYVTASIGIVTAARRRALAEELLRDADTAMYLAKSRGKAQHRVYEPGLNAAVATRLQTEGELRQALERGELRLHYQPIVHIDGGAVAGFEALLRWQHPERGLVAPGEFIPAAEDSGLIVPIGRWVLHEAARQAQQWQARHPLTPPLMMSVNVSPLQLQHPGFAEDVDAVLRETGVDPATLQLEITESAFLGEDPGIAELLAGFRARGIRLAIDDFGIGYSSMGYLKSFPVDTLKIDRSFIDRLGRDPEDTAIVRSLVSLARELGLCVSGEGIETQEQWDLLRHQNCEQGQGFYFARPLPADAADAYLENTLEVGTAPG